MLRQRFLKPLLCTVILLLCTLVISGNANAASKRISYAIVLESAPGTNLKWTHKKHPSFTGQTFFVQKTTIKGSAWERLCLGYFDTKEQATSVQKKIQKIYPGAWVNKASKPATKLSARQPVTPTPKVRVTAEQTSLATSGKLSEKNLDSLMQRAKTDFKNKNYSSAIRYLKALVAAGAHKYSPESLELLGLARQRKGQNSHAVDAYEKYLKLYPQSDGVTRVKQRLAGILTATSAPRKKIKMSSSEDIDGLELTSFGSLSQFYRNNRATTDDTGSVTTLSQLFTFLDLSSTARSRNFDYHFQFNADHASDFTDSKDDELRFIETYIELNYRKTGSSAKLGRQELPISGILKRFDGVSAGYQFTPDLRLNLIAGFPVDIDNKTSINDDKTIYGFTFETGTFLNHWDMNLFYFKQESDDLNDRSSIGTELRYHDKTISVFSMIDYDLLYDEVNVLQFNANLFLDHGRTLYLNALMRKSPELATSNALIGMSEQSLEELNKTLNLEQIYQLARDRTADTHTISIGGTQAISKKFQVTGDITMLHLDATPATLPEILIPAGVAGTEEIGPDYYISTQLVGNNLFTKYDTGILGLRYYQTEASDTVSFIVNTRFPINRNWRINPRLQYDIRKQFNGRKQEIIRAMLKTDYRYQRKIRFDFEIGYDDTSESNTAVNLSSNDLYFSLGYRWDF